MSRNHVLPPPAPIGNTVCCWPRCDYERSTNYGDFTDWAEEDFPLCAQHAAQVYAAVQHEREKFDDFARVQVQKRNERLPVSNRFKYSPDGWIYFARIGERIKVGHTAGLASRMKSYPPGSVLLAVIPGSRADELALHRELTPWRTDGREWYQPSPAIMRRIDDAKREHGDPPPLTPRPWDHDYKEPAPRIVRG